MTRDSVPVGDLAHLLDTERRLAERLRSARTEAESVIAQARADVEQHEAALAAELEADERRMSERLVRERRKRERAIAEAAQREVEAYNRVSTERLAEIACMLTRRLLEGEFGQ